MVDHKCKFKKNKVEICDEEAEFSGCNDKLQKFCKKHQGKCSIQYIKNKDGTYKRITLENTNNLKEEKAVVEGVKPTVENISNANVYYNKKLDYFNNINHRPDIAILTLIWLFIIEIDEKQHKHFWIYEELKRIYNIFSEGIRLGYSLNENKTFFIRFNPHSYRLHNKTYNIPFNDRILLLNQKIIQYHKIIVNYHFSRYIFVLYLYFDNYESDDVCQLWVFDTEKFKKQILNKHNFIEKKKVETQIEKENRIQTNNKIQNEIYSSNSCFFYIQESKIYSYITKINKPKSRIPNNVLTVHNKLIQV